MRLHKGLSNGRLYLSIVEGYRDPITKKVKTRTLRSLGYADSLAKIHGDPVAFGIQRRSLRRSCWGLIETCCLASWLGCGTGR
ncbi:hypothetical protein AGMMS49992_26020 [Clostridia bacterium]|nr:hypothetical protein AGMMS49992_26020 [Clostridia bacterium]